MGEIKRSQVRLVGASVLAFFVVGFVVLLASEVGGGLLGPISMFLGLGAGLVAAWLVAYRLASPG